MISASEATVEKLVDSNATAIRKAKKYLKLPDPFGDQNGDYIAPSLLSAAHIKKYIRETGLIWPFYEGEGRKSRLKKASYEGRIGNKAYVYDGDNKLQPVLVPGAPLKVRANSIVFVECDLDFRLPRYIALRFNLQIRHVHRGLLLGTGPLVDPGYWGKLCIPLHNLTNEDYEIPLEEGLIWVELTKTTSDSDEGRVTLAGGDKPSEHWEIEKFLDKASTSLVDKNSRIGIRSSIDTMVTYATDLAQDAIVSSNRALEVSERAASSASGAEAQAQETKDLFNRIGWLGALLATIAVLTLWATFYFGLRNDYNALQAQLINLGSEVADLQSNNGALLERLNTAQARLDAELRTVDAPKNEMPDLNATQSEIPSQDPPSSPEETVKNPAINAR